jgi:hypothetical protein
MMGIEIVVPLPLVVTMMVPEPGGPALLMPAPCGFTVSAASPDCVAWTEVGAVSVSKIAEGVDVGTNEKLLNVQLLVALVPSCR